MALELSLKLNNQTVTVIGSPIRIADEFPTLNWEFDFTERITVNASNGVITDAGEFSQDSYEVRVSTVDTDIETDSFIGTVASTGVLLGQEAFWRYSGATLVRGGTYYGQVRATDSVNRMSDWAAFSFTYNSLPSVSNVTITPLQPSVTDDLQLSYDFDDNDGDTESGTKIR